jgi:hypothetical protein
MVSDLLKKTTKPITIPFSLCQIILRKKNPSFKLSKKDFNLQRDLKPPNKTLKPLTIRKL